LSSTLNLGASVKIIDVQKHFGRSRSRVDVLRDINLEIKQGEFVALLGPSGCGKSTLMRLISGLDTPSLGSVTIDETVVSGVDPRCGVVFQEPRLLPWLSLRDNVELGANLNAEKVDVDALLARVGLAGFEKSLPREVSGGMAQRASLARGLAVNPKVLLLDEPFAALDALTRLTMQDLLLEVTRESKTTVIFVTHDIDEALHLADRVVVLAQRGNGIDEIVRIGVEKPRDRSHIDLVPFRNELFSKFGIHH
jgi:sulfonate transport system ATP-binding protein